jgi:hypothetical protein
VCARAQGIAEPIPLVLKAGRAGLGVEEEKAKRKREAEAAAAERGARQRGGARVRSPHVLRGLPARAARRWGRSWGR